MCSPLIQLHYCCGFRFAFALALIIISNKYAAVLNDSVCNKMLSYRRETALQGTLVLAESGRLELRDNILLIL